MELFMLLIKFCVLLIKLWHKLSKQINLSLFTEALKATGWYDKLNQPLVMGTVAGSTTATLVRSFDCFGPNK